MPAEDLAERRFVPEIANKLWVAGISYLPAWEGFEYLAFVLDAYSRGSWGGRWPLICIRSWLRTP